MDGGAGGGGGYGVFELLDGVAVAGEEEGSEGVYSAGGGGIEGDVVGGAGIYEFLEVGIVVVQAAE